MEEKPLPRWIATNWICACGSNTIETYAVGGSVWTPFLNAHPETGQILLDETYRNGPTPFEVGCANCIGGGTDELYVDDRGYVWQVATECPECGAALEVFRRMIIAECLPVSDAGRIREPDGYDFEEMLSREVRCETQVCTITNHVIFGGLFNDHVYKPVLLATSQQSTLEAV